MLVALTFTLVKNIFLLLCQIIHTINTAMVQRISRLPYLDVKVQVKLRGPDCHVLMGALSEYEGCNSG